MVNESKTEIHRSSFLPHLSRLWVVFLVCAVVYALLCGPTVHHAVFLNDDWFHVERIPRDRIPHLFWGDWHQGYRNIGGFYRPLPRLVMQFERLCFGLWTPGYLLVSGAVHVLNCALVWLIAMRLSGRLRTAWAAALFFAVFPTHAEALFQVSMLADLMATCGFLVAVFGYLVWRESSASRHGALALFGALLGALSKESWVALPLVLLWAECLWWRQGHPAREQTEPATGKMFALAKPLWRTGVFIILALVYVGFRHTVLGGVGGYGKSLTLASVRETYDAVFRIVLLPFGEIERWGDLINLFTLLGGMAVVWSVLDFPPLLLFAMGWMILTTLPILTLAPHLYDGGRLVYVVTVGWALFLGGVFEALVRVGRSDKSRRVIGLVVALILAGALIAVQVRFGADWRESFNQNRRWIAKMVKVCTQQPPDSHFAILNWPVRFGLAHSNRPDSAAKALSTLTGIESPRVEALLAPEASTGTITFTVTGDRRLTVGRVEGVKTWRWSGDQLEQWQPSGNVRLAHIHTDGPRDYEFADEHAGLLSPELVASAGYYSVLVRYRPTRRDRGSVMWHGPGESFEISRMATLHQMGRYGNEAGLANPGWVWKINQFLVVPAVGRHTVTLHSIEIARFDIGPFPP